uniref:Cytochrome b5 heme-binding domain-containing protein n=1 Tax=Pycnococcus provasolii TaxID=41880 RepID=A0A7S2FF75_9CHLO|mmetsp:Transcript_6776/g.15427  ORF Transcript_6776/g.15427 Transcript_6776/m.15427 type:complete len:222 (+) Transcript_6776:49-714(+)
MSSAFGATSPSASASQQSTHSIATGLFNYLPWFVTELISSPSLGGFEVVGGIPLSFVLLVFLLVISIFYLAGGFSSSASAHSDSDSQSKAKKGMNAHAHAHDDTPSQRPQSPVQLGTISKERLREIGTGTDPKAPIYIAVKGTIYDVTKGEDFYGPPDGPYRGFAGYDASHALAKMSLKPEDVHGDISGLSAAERDILDDWERKFQEKYTIVGQVEETVAR